ncbi:MAG TPA: aminodeoxychorismate/anthranilate synthase component II [Pirellulales bacterium]|nr:aminodeoxychorismate/anthranilate synthase component II [Pirellulales bacterium]
MILLIDNYDSFVFNLARYFERLGQATHVVRNDAIDVRGVEALSPEAIVLSPGPCAPDQAGCSLEIVQQLHRQVPLLGVCLGHQTIAQALGGRVVRAPEPVHGRASTIFHDRRGVFANLPNPLTVGRYHSLVVEAQTLPGELTVTARTGDGVVMSIEHRDLPVVGVQFHPESILTEHGYELLANFLQMAGLAGAVPNETTAAERRAAQGEPSPAWTSQSLVPPAETATPDLPVTF